MRSEPIEHAPGSKKAATILVMPRRERAPSGRARSTWPGFPHLLVQAFFPRIQATMQCWKSYRIGRLCDDRETTEDRSERME
jgi:hypothetical protein